MRSLLLGLSLMACSIESPDELSPDEGKADTATRSFLVIGHRGAPWTAPENTLPSFAAALREGANALEVDFCVTKDGHVVVWHDRDPDHSVSLLRQTGAEGLPWVPWVPNLGNTFRRPVDQLTLAELRANYDYAPNEGLIGSTLGSGDRVNAHLPTLEEFVAWSKSPEAKGLSAVYVDVKLADGQTELARHLAAEFARLTEGAPYQLLFGTPQDSIISTIRAWYRERGLEHRAKFMIDHEKAGVLEATRKGNYSAISMGKIVTRGWRSFLTEVRGVVEGAAKDRIDPVLVWTIDDDARMLQLIQLGVDGMLTNRPADLTRMVTSGFSEHDHAIRAIRDCYATNEGRETTAACASSIATAPLREDQLVDRACMLEDGVTGDVFGCGGLFDAQNVRFEAPLSSATRIWWDGDDEIVVVGK
jgi:glycerophosphoryl diester phosphodiesterase